MQNKYQYYVRIVYSRTAAQPLSKKEEDTECYQIEKHK